MIAQRIRFLSLTNDYVFKMFFSRRENRRFLIALLTVILKPQSPILRVTILSGTVPKENASGKGTELDLLIRLADGSLIILEMQAWRRPNLRQRWVFYGSRAFVAQLRSGELYGSLMPVTVVVFLNFRETPTSPLHLTYQLLEDRVHDPYGGFLRMHLLRTAKVVAEDAPLEDDPELLRWLRFLGATTDDEVEKVGAEDDMLAEAMKALEFLSLDPEVRRRAEDRERELAEYRSELAAERAGGRAEGLEEGRAEGRRETRLDNLIFLLTTKGIDLTPDALERVESSDSETLAAYFQRALTMIPGEDLFEGGPPCARCGAAQQNARSRVRQTPVEGRLGSVRARLVGAARRWLDRFPHDADVL